VLRHAYGALKVQCVRRLHAEILAVRRELLVVDARLNPRHRRHDDGVVDSSETELLSVLRRRDVAEPETNDARAPLAELLT
jgi:hypothetical protein